MRRAVLQRNFPPTLAWLGLPAIAGVWFLAGRLVWEQTVWTWERGAQMVGFSLMHSGAGGFLILAALASLLWPAIVLFVAVLRRSLGGKTIVILLAVYALGWILLFTPYGFWQRLFIAKFTPAQATELMADAAGSGDLRTLRAFLETGVSVNAQARYGTALHGAALNAQLDVMQYLISHGADVNAINAYGDSPMANAVQAPERSDEAQALLARHGGRLVQGTNEQRDRAVERELQEDERAQAEASK